MRSSSSVGVERAARVATELFSPPVLALLMPFVIAVQVSDPPLAGLGWGALCVLFAAATPYAALRILMRAGRVSGGHHVPERRQRTLPLLIALVSLIVGNVVLALLGAPRPVLVFSLVTIVLLLLMAVINLGWKISGHAAVVAVSGAILVIVSGPWTLLASVPIALWTGWSRLRLSAHTPAQVVAGFALGVVVTVMVQLFLG
ncbi:phosphatase PAP2 family protein [Microbacteriaceae bacterium VKM Ac-2855]|nr:phosphatase PAP2 family protein [Microbacteriaceae bacterium VKM Ac-2855]